MSRRIDIELTSALADGSWTWRAAGARKPNGVVESTVLPAGSGVGDILKVEVEQMLDGIEVLSVVQGREKGDAGNLLELIPSDKPFQEVIETRAKRDRSDRPDRGGRDARDGRGKRKGDNRRDGRGRDGDGTGAGASGDGRREQRRPHFEAPPELPQRPKPKRLRPGKARRNEVLAALPEEQRPIAELALLGMSAVRTRVAEENAKLTAESKPTMPEASVVKMAEEMLPKLRVAEWLDRAEAAQRQMEHLDLRDLRSVVAAGEDSIVARDESTRVIAEELKVSLARKQEEELQLWYGDIGAAIEVGRVIRALRLSSQPPKAGVMFPPALARRLGDAGIAALLPDDPADRWIAVLESVAFSPVRTLVVPTAAPSTVTDDLRKTMLRLGPALPQIAALLGVEIPAGTPKPKPLRPQTQRRNEKGPDKGANKKGGRGPRAGAGAGKPAGNDKPAAIEPVADAPAPDAPTTDAPIVETPVADAPAVDAPVLTDTPVVTDAPVLTDTPVVEPAVVEDTPVVESPVAADAPVVDAPVVDTPVVDTPVVDTPVVDTPVVDAPVVDDTPVTNA